MTVTPARSAMVRRRVTGAFREWVAVRRRPGDYAPDAELVALVHLEDVARGARHVLTAQLLGQDPDVPRGSHR